MRVISGLASGFKLKSPDGFRVRPTADRIKESLFNKIAFKLPGAHFLDLFGGTGAIGIEALSRGAEFAVITDNSLESCDIIKQNLSHTKLADKARVLNADYSKAIESLKLENRSFDFIFIDPPYHTRFAELAIEKIKKLGILNKDGLIIVETSVGEKIHFLDYRVSSEKKYGTTMIYILCE